MKQIKWRRSERRRLRADRYRPPGTSMLTILIMLACLMVIVLQGWNEWRVRVVQLKDSTVSLINLAGALSRQAEDTIKITDTILATVVERLETDGTSSEALARLDRVLRMHVDKESRHDLPTDGVITLLTAKGIVLPFAGSFMTASLGETPMIRELKTHSAGTFAYEYSSTIDGVRRLGAYREMERYPLVLLAAVSKDRLFAGWATDARIQVAIALAMAMIIGLLGLFLIQQMRRSLAAREAAYESEARFRILADYANDVVTCVGPDGLWLYVSPAAQRVTGLPPEALLGSKFLDYVHFDDRQVLIDRSELLLRGDAEAYLPAFRILRPDGTEVWIEASSRILHHPTTGLPDGYVSLLRDVTQDVAAITALYKSEERCRLLLQSDGVVEAIYMLDIEGIIESWNAGAERITSYTAEDVVGQNFSMFLTPEDIKDGKATRMLAAARNVGKFSGTGWRMRKDGSRFWARVTLEAIYLDDGTLRGFAKVTQDITNEIVEKEKRMKLEEAEKALRESEETLRLLLHSNVTEALYLLSADGTIESWNCSAERIKGYTATEIIGQNFSIFFDLEDVAAGLPGRLLEEAREFGSYCGILLRVRKDSSRFMARIAIDAIPKLDGHLRGFVVVTHDITQERIEEAERNRMSRELAVARDQAELSNKAKSQFVASVTHELRTPLHGMLGYAELLSMDGGLDELQSERVNVIIASGQHLLDMINMTLDLSKIEADELELLPKDTSLVDLIQSCLDVVRPTAAAKGLTLIPCSSGPVRLLVDPTRLRQVLINLLGNAIKFTMTGSVEVRVQKLEGGRDARLEVVDTGPGVQLKHRDKLFQAFERLDDEAVNGVEGTGLGLALAARLVRLMGGQIGYLDNPRGGSVFWLELPVGECLPPETKARISFDQLLQKKPVLRVLVADDELITRKIASEFLTHAGHEVVCVDSGKAAVEAATAGGFDAILMDVRMPGMNGMEATRKIRCLPDPCGAVHVVAVSAQAFAQQIEMCLQAGMNGHVSKPFTRTALLTALETVQQSQSLAGSPMAETTIEAGSSTKTFDPDTFETATQGLSAQDLEESLQTLFARCEALLAELHQPGMLPKPSKLVHDVHKLAGGAGTLGFQSIAASARQFEIEATAGGIGVEVYAKRLTRAIELSMPTIRNVTASVAEANAGAVGA